MRGSEEGIKDTGKFLRVKGVFTILIPVMVSQV